jgi:hypothetical protein
MLMCTYLSVVAALIRTGLAASAVRKVERIAAHPDLVPGAGKQVRVTPAGWRYAMPGSLMEADLVSGFAGRPADANVGRGRQRGFVDQFGFARPADMLAKHRVLLDASTTRTTYDALKTAT